MVQYGLAWFSKFVFLPSSGKLLTLAYIWLICCSWHGVHVLQFTVQIRISFIPEIKIPWRWTAIKHIFIWKQNITPLWKTETTNRKYGFRTLHCSILLPCIDPFGVSVHIFHLFASLVVVPSSFLYCKNALHVSAYWTVFRSARWLQYVHCKGNLYTRRLPIRPKHIVCVYYKEKSEQPKLHVDEKMYWKLEDYKI
jgi:hypothetical protein